MANLRNAVLKEYKDSSYAKFNLNKNPFYHLNRTTKKPPELLGRLEEEQAMSRYLADMLKGELDSVTILGQKGIGKTHFLLYVFNEIESAIKKSGELEKKYEVRLIRGVDEFESFITEAKPPQTKKLIIFIDEADQCWRRFPDGLKKIYEQKETLTVAAWNLSLWNNAKHQQGVSIPKTKSLKLIPLSEEICEQILRSRIKSELIDKKGLFPFDDSAIMKLANSANGVPHTLLTYAEVALQEALQQKFDKVTETVVENILADRNIDATETMERTVFLPRAQKRVLLAVHQHTNSYRRKVDASSIATEIQRSRVAVVIVFQKLKDDGYLEATRVGKKVLYSLTRKGVRVSEGIVAEEATQKQLPI